MTELELRVPVAASVETTWAAMTDWARQGEWMLGTSVRVTGGDGRGVGSTLAAFTGAGPVGFTDTMRITEWEPPSRCVVLHTGAVVRGTGEFLVSAVGESASEFVWVERLELPFGVVGRVGWPLVRPAFVWGVRRSLTAFARFAEGYGR
ncbi:SRPBCC family protein [Umezawaea sp. NPDC059074]|uniref:SRPBCC family protein n=1 Tax=Umezawaea sp. NPDC059074 TaxID=3346716 RepID=UPI003674A70A